MITAIIMMFVVGAVLGLILGIASNVFKVEVDERVEKVTAMLQATTAEAAALPDVPVWRKPWWPVKLPQLQPASQASRMPGRRSLNI